MVRFVSSGALIAVACFAAQAQQGGLDDWHRLWLKSGTKPPATAIAKPASLGDLGLELPDREWLIVRTKYHELYYSASADADIIAEVFQLVDNLDEFLSERSPRKAQTPIKVFLVPGEHGRSRCSPKSVAMRTGADAGIAFLVSSLLHEETHLFNFAYLENAAQGWWTGEYSCQYFQERARLTKQGADVKAEFATRLPKGPIALLSSLESHGPAAFDEAQSAMLFLEETYGIARINEFRRQSLIASAATNGRPLPGSVFQQVFGKSAGALDGEWREFFGWKVEKPQFPPPGTDVRLQTLVTYSTRKKSVQFIVIDLAKLLGLRYDWDKSFAQTDPICRRFIDAVSIEKKPGHQALDDLLTPLKLCYQVEDGAIVLYHR